ncbi:hypothetical protein BDV95DRAFT_502973 [Massariosphaeria phaeospora]|uniref:Uncharacterized protein n=1 Tax=Massariosphaeria phaeospora TaxID=100035 RepID=A0A7C8M1S7_9PLEO|nr:hypothetical protein BDV95DRAFT_502973 [Massariosphaeria phaeospora]
MSSHHEPRFQPPPPIRTSTMGSQSSGNMSPASDTLSPTSTFTRGGGSATSPTEESFFGAITSRMLRGRSRSRSRATVSRKRSKSPMPMSPMSPTSPQQPRHASSASQSSMSSIATKPTRPSLQGAQRRSTNSSDMWRGRHSNSWLFNDFSVTDTAKDILNLGRKS